MVRRAKLAPARRVQAAPNSAFDHYSTLGCSFDPPFDPTHYSTTYSTTYSTDGHFTVNDVMDGNRQRDTVIAWWSVGSVALRAITVTWAVLPLPGMVLGAI